MGDEYRQSNRDAVPIFVIEKRKRSTAPWHFLCAFGDEKDARDWLRKPHKSGASYRCRRLESGPDITEELLTFRATT